MRKMPARKKSKNKTEPAPAAEPSAPLDRATLTDEHYEDKDIEMGEVGETDATEDIYNDEQREEMLQDDEISAEENAFVEGTEIAMTENQYRKGKKVRAPGHEDTPSVELAEMDAKQGDEPSDTETP